MRKNGGPVQGSTVQTLKSKPGYGIRTAIRENWPVLSDEVIIQARIRRSRRIRELPVALR
jgi:hypothetical protein